MASRYQQVTDPEEAWKYYEAGLLLRRVHTFSYGPKGQETCTHYKVHEIADKKDKPWVIAELYRLPDAYFVLVEDD